MEWFNDLIVNNWDKVLAWLSMIPASALIWKLGNIFVRLIQNWTAKKYTKKQSIHRYKSSEFQNYSERDCYCVKKERK